MSKGWVAKELRRYLPPALLGKAYLVDGLRQRLLYGGWRELERNRVFHRRHAGERAFVIGNGPSLNKMNLAPLRQERVFTVNSFFRYASALGIRPFCHTFLDPWFFDPQGPPDLTDFSATRHPDTLCFVPLAFKSSAQRILSDPHFLLLSGRLNANRNWDLTGVIPGLQTVTLAAIVIAQYMGFAPIYLIGCDMDMLNHVVGVDPLRVREKHFYDEKEEIVVQPPSFDYAGYASAILRMFEGYRAIRNRTSEACPIFNAGVGGMLDVFPRVDYASLF